MSAPSANSPQGGNPADAAASVGSVAADASQQPVPNGVNAPPQVVVNQAGVGVAPAAAAPIVHGPAAAPQGAALAAPVAGAPSLSAQEVALVRALLAPDGPLRRLIPAGPPAAAAAPPAAVPNLAGISAGQGDQDEADSIADIIRTANLTDFDQVSSIFQRAAHDASLAHVSLPDSVKWSGVKPSGMRAEAKVTKLPELIVSASNVYSKLLIRELTSNTLNAIAVAELLAEFIAVARETCRSQLAVVKLASDAPAAEALLRDAYGKVFDMVNPTTPQAALQEVQLRRNVLEIALTKQRLEKSGKRSGGGGGGGQGGRSHGHHAHGSGRGGSRGGRNNSHGAGSGASASQAPAGQS